MGVYRNNLLPIIVITQKSFDLSITDIAFVIYFVIAINDSLCTQCSILASWRYGKNTRCPVSLFAVLKKSLFVLLNTTAESVNCSLFSKNMKNIFAI